MEIFFGMQCWQFNPASTWELKSKLNLPHAVIKYLVLSCLAHFHTFSACLKSILGNCHVECKWWTSKWRLLKKFKHRTAFLLPCGSLLGQTLVQLVTEHALFQGQSDSNSCDHDKIYWSEERAGWNKECVDARFEDVDSRGWTMSRLRRCDISSAQRRSLWSSRM